MWPRQLRRDITYILMPTIHSNPTVHFFARKNPWIFKMGQPYVDEPRQWPWTSTRVKKITVKDVTGQYYKAVKHKGFHVFLYKKLQEIIQNSKAQRISYLFIQGATKYLTKHSNTKNFIATSNRIPQKSFKEFQGFLNKKLQTIIRNSSV